MTSDTATSTVTVTVPEALSVLEGQESVSAYLHEIGIRLQTEPGDIPFIGTGCPVAIYLREVTDERHVIVGTDNVFVFDNDPVMNEMPLPKEIHEIPIKVRAFVRNPNIFYRFWEPEDSDPS